MLWPFMQNRAMRTQLFAMLATEEPDFFVHRWGQYKFDVPSLRPVEIEKIERAADTIATSFATPFPVRAVLMQGHADYDLRRFGNDREDFEIKISRARALEVERRLRKSLDDKRPLLTPEAVMLLDLMVWQREWFGSHRRVTTIPRTEYEMSLNRRVEVFFARAARPLRPATLMACPHSGLVIHGRPGFPSVEDGWIVVGCPFVVFPAQPSPCLRVEWIDTNDGIIDLNSLGICLGPGDVNQGLVVFVA